MDLASAKPNHSSMTETGVQPKNQSFNQTETLTKSGSFTYGISYFEDTFHRRPEMKGSPFETQKQKVKTEKEKRRRRKSQNVGFGRVSRGTSFLCVCVCLCSISDCRENTLPCMADGKVSCQELCLQTNPWRYVWRSIEHCVLFAG